MSRKVRVGLVFAGRSCEHEVSLSSARSVFEAIDRTKYDLTLIHIAKNGEWRLPAIGVPYSELIDRLIGLAIEAYRDRRDVRSVL